MTQTELVTEINKLPLADWEAIKAKVDNGRTNGEPKPQMTEDEINKILFAEGIIGNIPDLSKWTDEDEDWEPIEVLGEPLSEMIIRERR